MKWLVAAAVCGSLAILILFYGLRGPDGYRVAGPATRPVVEDTDIPELAVLPEGLEVRALEGEVRNVEGDPEPDPPLRSIAEEPEPGDYTQAEWMAKPEFRSVWEEFQLDFSARLAEMGVPYEENAGMLVEAWKLGTVRDAFQERQNARGLYQWYTIGSPDTDGYALEFLEGRLHDLSDREWAAGRVISEAMGLAEEWDGLPVEWEEKR